MISEEHKQLESSSGLVSSNGFHDAQHVQTALEPLPVSEPMTNSHTAEVLAQTYERDLSATVEEVELTTVLDRTLIEEGNNGDSSSKKHAKVPSGSSISFQPKGHVSKKSRDSHSTRLDGSVEGGSPTSWHPLHSKDGEMQGYDTTRCWLKTILQMRRESYYTLKPVLILHWKATSSRWRNIILHLHNRSFILCQRLGTFLFLFFCIRRSDKFSVVGIDP